MPNRKREILDRTCGTVVNSVSLVLLLLLYWPYTLTLKFKHVLR